MRRLIALYEKIEPFIKVKDKQPKRHEDISLKNNFYRGL
jgi:hypothetical protein